MSGVMACCWWRRPCVLGWARAFRPRSISLSCRQHRIIRSQRHQSEADTPFTRQAAQDFVWSLSPEERNIFQLELEKFQREAARDDHQGLPPTAAQLRAVASHSALPFIGFGFLDNFIMIIAGDYIDTTIGVTLGISTMAAAGLGNTLSDIAGIGSAWYVENLAVRIGVRPPQLTPAQVDMKSTRWCANLGRAVGVTVGCLLGMLPLLFLKEREPQEGNQNKEQS